MIYYDRFVAKLRHSLLFVCRMLCIFSFAQQGTTGLHASAALCTRQESMLHTWCSHTAMLSCIIKTIPAHFAVTFRIKYSVLKREFCV